MRDLPLGPSGVGPGPDGLHADLYVWSQPADLDEREILDRLGAWERAGADPAMSPFEPSTDVGWFARELVDEHPWVRLVTDAVPRKTSTPIWRSGTDERPARLVAIGLPPGLDGTSVAELRGSVYGLAAKYDLTVFAADAGRLHRPLDEMASSASPTFWPRGAIQAGMAGIGGLVLAVIAWGLSIPFLSGIAILVGGFLFVLAVLTLGHEAFVRLRRQGATHGG